MAGIFGGVTDGTPGDVGLIKCRRLVFHTGEDPEVVVVQDAACGAAGKAPIRSHAGSWPFGRTDGFF